MKMRTTAAALFVALLVGAMGGTAEAQIDTTPITNDFNTMLGGIGTGILPYVQQAVLADQGIGSASLGSSRFYIGGALGATFAPGLIGTIVDQPYEVLNVQKIVDGLLGNAGGAQNTISFLTKTYPEPDLKLAAGVRTVAGIEVLGTFSIVPGKLVDLIVNAANLPALSLSVLNASLRVRKTLIDDRGGFPAVAVGAGYSYASLTAGAKLSPISVSMGGGTTLDVTGTQLNLATTVHSAGLSLEVSKRLAIFTPYVRFMPWYEWAHFSGSAEASAALSTGTAKQISASNPIWINDLAIILAGGMEIRLGAFVLVPGGSYDLLTNRLSANLSSRLQF